MNAPTLKNCDVYLTVCEGQGDVDVGLVNQETWDWIHSDFDSDESSYQETVPQSILNAYPGSNPNTVHVTIGSYDNDRVLQGPKISFNSIKAAMKYVKDNNCNLVDEYHGCIY